MHAFQRLFYRHYSNIHYNLGKCEEQKIPENLRMFYVYGDKDFYLFLEFVATVHHLVRGAA